MSAASSGHASGCRACQPRCSHRSPHQYGFHHGQLSTLPPPTCGYAPSTSRLSEEPARGLTIAHARRKWYAIFEPAIARGVYRAWDQVSQYVLGYSNAQHKGFPSEAAALTWLQELERRAHEQEQAIVPLRQQVLEAAAATAAAAKKAAAAAAPARLLLSAAHPAGSPLSAAASGTQLAGSFAPNASRAEPAAAAAAASGPRPWDVQSIVVPMAAEPSREYYKKFYAVRFVDGGSPAVYNTWPEAQAAIKGRYAEHESFRTYDEALTFAFGPATAAQVMQQHYSGLEGEAAYQPQQGEGELVPYQVVEGQQPQYLVHEQHESYYEYHEEARAGCPAGASQGVDEYAAEGYGAEGYVAADCAEEGEPVEDYHVNEEEEGRQLQHQHFFAHQQYPQEDQQQRGHHADPVHQQEQQGRADQHQDWQQQEANDQGSSSTGFGVDFSAGLAALGPLLQPFAPSGAPSLRPALAAGDAAAAARQHPVNPGDLSGRHVLWGSLEPWRGQTGGGGGHPRGSDSRPGRALPLPPLLSMAPASCQGPQGRGVSEPGASPAATAVLTSGTLTAEVEALSSSSSPSSSLAFSQVWARDAARLHALTEQQLQQQQLLQQQQREFGEWWMRTHGDRGSGGVATVSATGGVAAPASAAIGLSRTTNTQQHVTSSSETPVTAVARVVDPVNGSVAKRRRGRPRKTSPLPPPPPLGLAPVAVTASPRTESGLGAAAVRTGASAPVSAAEAAAAPRRRPGRPRKAPAASATLPASAPAAAAAAAQVSAVDSKGALGVAAGGLAATEGIPDVVPALDKKDKTRGSRSRAAPGQSSSQRHTLAFYAGGADWKSLSPLATLSPSDAAASSDTTTTTTTASSSSSSVAPMPGRCEYAAVLLDDEGTLVSCTAGMLSYNHPYEAPYSALVAGLRSAVRRGLDRLDMVGPGLPGYAPLPPPPSASPPSLATRPGGRQAPEPQGPEQPGPRSRQDLEPQGSDQQQQQQGVWDEELASRKGAGEDGGSDGGGGEASSLGPAVDAAVDAAVARAMSWMAQADFAAEVPRSLSNPAQEGMGFVIQWGAEFRCLLPPSVRPLQAEAIRLVDQLKRVEPVDDRWARSQEGPGGLQQQQRGTESGAEHVARQVAALAAVASRLAAQWLATLSEADLEALTKAAVAEAGRLANLVLEQQHQRRQQRRLLEVNEQQQQLPEQQELEQLQQDGGAAPLLKQFLEAVDSTLAALPGPGAQSPAPASPAQPPRGSSSSSGDAELEDGSLLGGAAGERVVELLWHEGGVADMDLPALDDEEEEEEVEAQGDDKRTRGRSEREPGRAQQSRLALRALALRFLFEELLRLRQPEDVEQATGAAAVPTEPPRRRGRGRPRTRPTPAGAEEQAVARPADESEQPRRGRGRPRTRPLPEAEAEPPAAEAAPADTAERPQRGRGRPRSVAVVPPSQPDQPEASSDTSGVDEDPAEPGASAA